MFQPTTLQQVACRRKGGVGVVANRKVFAQQQAHKTILGLL